MESRPYMEKLREEKNDYLKIFSNDDARMQKVGQVLTSPKSRKIYGLLTHQQLNAKEIGKLVENTDNPRLPIMIFILDKMVDAGLLSIEKKPQKKGGHLLKYYKAIPFILIVPPTKLEKAKSSKTLRNTFKTVFKLTIIGTATILTFSSTPFNFELTESISFTSGSIFIPIIHALTVGAMGYLINKFYIFLKKKQKTKSLKTIFRLPTLENSLTLIESHRLP